MRNALAIFRFELAARRQALMLAAVIGALILAAPFVPGLGNQRPGDVREAASITFAIALGYGLAVALGATIFGGDLSEQRLGFFFARPVSGLSVWVGRMTAVSCAAMLAELIVLLPPLLAGAGTFDLLVTLGWWAVPLLIVGPALVLLLAHAVSVMVRARTPWLVLDLVGIIGAVVAACLVLLPVVLWCSFGAAVAAASVFVAALLAALALAGAVGVASGRTDLRRVHAVLSLTLWLAVAAGWAGAVTYARWLDDFGPRNLMTVDHLERVDPTGRWVVVTGRGEHRFNSPRRFIVSTGDDRFVALRLRDRWLSWRNQEVIFAAGGEAAAWFEDADEDEPRSIWRVDLTATELTPVETTITVPGDSELDLSPDGGRVALRDEDGLLSVYDLTNEALLTMARLPEEDEKPACVFVENDTVRCFTVLKGRDNRRSCRIHELDVASGELRLTGETELGEGDAWPTMTAYSPSLLGVSGCPGETCRLRFFDPRTGVLEREAALPEWATAAAALADGRLVVRSGGNRDQLTLGIEDQETGEWIAHDLGGDAWIGVGGEAVPGRLVVFRARIGEDGDWLGQRAELFDLATGTTRSLAGDGGNSAGYTLSQRAFWQTGTPMRWQPEAWRLFADSRRGLLRWDPETDSLTTIAGGAE